MGTDEKCGKVRVYSVNFRHIDILWTLMANALQCRLNGTEQTIPEGVMFPNMYVYYYTAWSGLMARFCVPCKNVLE